MSPPSHGGHRSRRPAGRCQSPKRSGLRSGSRAMDALHASAMIERHGRPRSLERRVHPRAPGSPTAGPCWTRSRAAADVRAATRTGPECRPAPAADPPRPAGHRPWSPSTPAQHRPGHRAEPRRRRAAAGSTRSPRAGSPGQHGPATTAESQWTRAQAACVRGYATGHCLAEPFLCTWPGVEAHEDRRQSRPGVTARSRGRRPAATTFPESLHTRTGDPAVLAATSRRG